MSGSCPEGHTRHVTVDPQERPELAASLRTQSDTFVTDLPDGGHHQAVTTPIADIPAGTSTHQIISEWRDLERKLEALDPSSVEAIEARLMIDAYRRAYRAALDAQLEDPATRWPSGG